MLISSHPFSPEISYFLLYPFTEGGYALAIVVGLAVGQQASGLFTSYITMLIAHSVLFASPGSALLLWNIR